MHDALTMVVGLGNYPAEYHATRHNIGWMTLDACAASCGGLFKKKRLLHAACLLCDIDGVPVLFVKPYTYMNLSGIAVQKMMHFYHVGLDRLIVIHDDIDLPLGCLKIRQGGRSGGHNGIQSIIDTLGSGHFIRIKMGIGRPAETMSADISDFVLAPFAAHERVCVHELIKQTITAVGIICKKGIHNAMNQFNKK